MTSKASLRARFKAQRARVAPELRAEAGQRLAETVMAYTPFADAATVGLFASYRDEIPTDSLVEAMRRAGRRVLLPRVADAGDDMTLCEFSSLEVLGHDRFGIRTPDGPSFTGLVELVFVPGLAFGKDGSRLGYGGGFYDRLLAQPRYLGALRCGIGYAEQVVEALPTEAHDVRLTHIATPEQIVVCSV